jgi:hypothetical protein
MIVVTWFRDLDHKRAAPLECERLHVITVTLFGARLRRQSALAQCFFSSRRETRKIVKQERYCALFPPPRFFG